MLMVIKSTSISAWRTPSATARRSMIWRYMCGRCSCLDAHKPTNVQQRQGRVHGDHHPVLQRRMSTHAASLSEGWPFVRHRSAGFWVPPWAARWAWTRISRVSNVQRILICVPPRSLDQTLSRSRYMYFKAVLSLVISRLDYRNAPLIGRLSCCAAWSSVAQN